MEVMEVTAECAGNYGIADGKLRKVSAFTLHFLSRESAKYFLFVCFYGVGRGVETQLEENGYVWLMEESG